MHIQEEHKMNIGLIINLVLWSIAVIQWFIIYKIDIDIQKIKIDISEPRLGVKV